MNSKSVASTVIFLMIMAYAQTFLAQNPETAIETNNYIQEKRHIAGELFEKVPKLPDNIMKGISILDSALTFLKQPRIEALSKNNRYLRICPSDLCCDIAVGYAMLGDKEKSIVYLKRLASIDVSYSTIITRIEKEKVFSILHDLPEYKQLTNQFKLFGSLFNNKTILTGYSANISDAEKIAGLTLFWNEVKNKFVYFDKLPDLDWNATYLDYLSKVTKTKSTLEYYWQLQKMCALLKDGHTNVNPPAALNDSIYARPPIRMALVENKVIVWQVLSDSLLRSGFKPGQEIISIDDVPVKEYAKQFVEPFISSSTPQDLRETTYAYSLLSGNKTKPIKLVMKEGAKNITRIVARSGYKDRKPTPDLEYRLLENNIAYVQLNTFGGDNVKNLFKARFEEILKADALILDLRFNGGGSSNIAYNILAYLTETKFNTSSYAYRASNEDLSLINYSSVSLNPTEGKKFNKPVVLLISSSTFSAAEDFVMSFDAMKRGKLIGEPTCGSTGQPYSFKLPGGLEARICMKRSTYPDGKEFVGVGIQPDILVVPTIADIRDCNDVVLKKAIEYLKVAPKK